MGIKVSVDWGRRDLLVKKKWISASAKEQWAEEFFTLEGAQWNPGSHSFWINSIGKYDKLKKLQMLQYNNMSQLYFFFKTA